MFSISLADVAVNEFSEDAEVFVETLNGLLSRLGAAGGKSVAAAEACISEVLARGFSLGSETQEPPICCDASGCS